MDYRSNIFITLSSHIIKRENATEKMQMWALEGKEWVYFCLQFRDWANFRRWKKKDITEIFCPFIILVSNVPNVVPVYGHRDFQGRVRLFVVPAPWELLCRYCKCNHGLWNLYYGQLFKTKISQDTPWWKLLLMNCVKSIYYENKSN